MMEAGYSASANFPPPPPPMAAPPTSAGPTSPGPLGLRLRCLRPAPGDGCSGSGSSAREGSAEA